MPANSKLTESVGQDRYNKGLSIVIRSNVVTLIGNWEWKNDEHLLKFDFNAILLNFDYLITVHETNYLVHPDDFTEVRKKINALRSGQHTDYSFRIIHPNGDVKRITGHAILLLEDQEQNKTQRLAVSPPTHSIPAEGIPVHKATTEELQKFEEIVKSTHEAIMSVNAEGIITHWNPAAEKLYGYHQEEVIGKHLRLIVPESAMEKNRLIWQKVLEGQSIHDFEAIRVRKDGKLIEVLLNISPFRDENGKIVGGCAIARNITEKKRAEKILDTIDHAYFELDATLCIKYVNRSAIALLQSPVEALKDKKLWEVFPEEKNSRGYQVVTEAIEQKKNLRAEYFSSVVQGWLSISANISDDGLIIMLYDIHEIIEAKEKVRENEQRLRALIDYSPDTIFRINKDLKLISGNAVLEKVTGMTIAELSRENPWQHGHDPEKLLPVLEKFSEVFDTGLPNEFFIDYKTPMGIKHFHGRIAPEFDALGKVNSIIVTTRDISRIKKAEEDEKKSHQRLRKVLDVIPHMAWVSYDGNTIDFYNERWYEYTGFLPDQLRWEDVFHPAQLPEIINHWRMCLREGIPYQAESLVKSSQNKYRWHLGIALPVKDEQGNIEMWIGTLTDIHDRLKAEKALRRSEEKFRTLVENTPDIIARWEKPLRIVFVNSAITKKTGLPTESLIDKPYVELPLPKSLKRSLARKLKEVFHTASPTDLFSEIPTEKSIQYFHTQIIPELTMDGSIESILSITTDITEFKEVQQKLEKANEFMSLSIEASKGGLATWDKNSGRTEFDRRGLEIMGFSSAEDAVHLDQWLDKIHEEDREKVIIQARQTLETNENLWLDFRVHHPDNTIHNVLGTGRIKKDKSGVPASAAGLVIDITELKKTEEQLQKVNETLFTRNEELKKMNEELTTLAFVASHDLREPLRKIEAFSDAIQRKDYTALSEISQEYFKRMLNAIQRMNALIDDILVFSKTNMEEHHYFNFDLNEVLNDVKNDLSEKINLSKAKILSSPLPVFYGNPINFHQLLQNLISNSLKFQYPGSIPVIQISATYKQGEEINSPHAFRFKTYLELSVSDNGIGFEQQYAAKIFKMFQRLHTTRDYPGTGMGLAICKKMAERYNGFIMANSIPGQGSTFKCYFQLMKEEK